MTRHAVSTSCPLWSKSAQTAAIRRKTGRLVLDGERKNWRCERDSNPRIMVLQTIPLDHLGIAPKSYYALKHC